MSKPLAEITPAIAEFIGAQRVFFVATAPLAGDGHLNLSPKGLDTFAIVGPTRVAYLDLTGSGIETLAHLRENGRIVILFCAFEGQPNIVRLHGRGEALEPGCPDFTALLAKFPSRFTDAEAPEHAAVRSIISVSVTRASTSCGFGVPRYRFESERSKLLDWSRDKGPGGMAEYRRKQNARSIDGLPGLTA